MKTALTIAGSDCSGGAGIQADIKTMTMNGVYAMSVITSLTAQNTTGIRSILDVTPRFLCDQIDMVFEDIFPDAVKIGMIPSEELIAVTSERLIKYKARNIVVDPVMVSTSGKSLINEGAALPLAEKLFPIASLVTPNIPEAEILAGMKIISESDMESSAKIIAANYGCDVLIKGGHNSDNANDVLWSDGIFTWFRSPRIDNPNTHGTGCTLSSMIASELAKNHTKREAIRRAKNYITGALSAGLDLGNGSGPLNHAFLINKEK